MAVATGGALNDNTAPWTSVIGQQQEQIRGEIFPMSSDSPSFFEKRRSRKWAEKRRALGYASSELEPNTDQRNSAGALHRKRSDSDNVALTLILSSVLVSAAIVVHGYLTRPPRYQIVRVNESQVARLDTRTGIIVRCGGASPLDCGDN